MAFTLRQRTAPWATTPGSALTWNQGDDNVIDLHNMITGGTSTFTGNTNATCIENIFLTNLTGCSGNGVTIGPRLTVLSAMTIESGSVNDNATLVLAEGGVTNFYIETDYNTTGNPVHFKNNAGSHLMTFKTSDKRIGVNKNAPDAIFHIAAPGDVGVFDEETTIIINNTSGIDWELQRAAVRFLHETDREGALVASGRDTEYTGVASTHNGYLSFSTAAEGVQVEAMRITSAQIVGIGTTAPDSGTTLHVSGNSRTDGIIYSGTTDIGTLMGGGGGTPGGSSIDVQWNNAGVFSGSSNFTWAESATTLTITGHLAATTKSFEIDHPTQEGKTLTYGALEGPEHGVFVRGELKDNNIINLPEHWSGLVHEDSITVQLTAIGKPCIHYVEEIKDYNVFVGCEDGLPHCYYLIHGERKDVGKLEIEK